MKLSKIVPRNENFADWYTSVVMAAKLALYTEIKGEMIFQPNGWAIWSNIQKELDQRFKKYGILNVALPSFIKMSEFTKEKEHIEGFAPETFLVTHIGNKPLEESYILRPTSEVVFCYYFKKILSSYNDLPIKYNQWCNVFRAEKTTRPFLRTSEFFWHELHTLHATQIEAEEQAVTMINEYYDFVTKFLCIPVLKGEKTEGERFAGAEHTYTIEAIMQDGQALQCGTSHYLGQGFAKTYDITFQDKNNKLSTPYQTSAGVSTRLIGAIIMSHSDDHGLVLPFNVAPVQVALLPLFVNKNPEIMDVVKKIESELQSKNIITKVDSSDKSFGFKLSEQEVLGTPFSIIFGPKDIANNECTIFRRDTLEKIQCNINSVVDKIISLSKEYDNCLFNKAKANMMQRTISVNTKEEFIKAISENKLIIAPWGGNPDDEANLKKETGVTTRCIKEEIKDNNTKCFFTGKKAKYLVYFARAY